MTEDLSKEDLFLDSLEHPFSLQVQQVLKDVGVSVFGSWVGNTQSMDDKSGDHPYVHRLRIQTSSSEEEWIVNRILDEPEMIKDWDGQSPKINQNFTVDYESSEIHPVPPETLEWVSQFLNLFDCLVINNVVYVGSHLHKYDDFSYDYQITTHWDWEEQTLGVDNDD
jgi:hypothetical protein